MAIKVDRSVIDDGVNALQAQKPQQKAAFAALAAFAATVLVSAAPVQAADVKTTVCNSNPTAKICLKDSAKK